ncbi:MMPL family transporter [Nocardioides marmoriginsengisoli]|uniref:MMPL family transporter n=1 Tax=Nocardioides marmoriginsengisoli TaxID=661483 RepID=A0A3N0CG19_9ACTN|nr:MMPL family transporter [Nocardioides marmoriginsengisoli]RNL62385.1 MMPL family transporter [Nocardioides marmoriginsengisoli]
MAWHLYRLGRWSFRHRRAVLALWVGLLLAMGVASSTLSGKTSDEFGVPGIESTQAFDLIKERTPDAAPDGATARIVYQAPKGETLESAANKALVLESLEATRTDHVIATSDPYAAGTVSEDGRTAYATVSYSKQSIELTDADRTALETSPDEARDAGLRVEIGGDAMQEAPETGTSELLGIVVAILVLVLTFGSMLVAGMPLLTALIGVGIGVTGITTLTGFMELGSTTPILAMMLGLAVGIDYALFIVSRYRHEVETGVEREEAAGRAVGTAGSAVVFAGLTVIIALAGLAIVNISFLTEMGLAAAGTVAVAVLIALTLLPALFGFAGKRITSGKLPFLKARDPEAVTAKPTRGRRWADFVTKHRTVTFVAGLAVAGVIAIPVASMQLALPDDGTAAAGSGPREAYDLIAENFGAGTNGPLMVVVDTKNSGHPVSAIEQVVEKVESIKSDVAAVISPVPDAGDAEATKAFDEQLDTAQYALVTVIPESGPSEARTQTLVDDIRDAVKDTEAKTGAQVLVTGQTALGVDISESLAKAFPRYLLVVVGFAFLLLMIVFRSIWVPLKAIVGFLLSVGVSLGATVAVFQWGWLSELIGVDKSGPVLFMLPLLLTGILFGLAMDYEVFLVSRMREEYVHGKAAVRSVVLGFQHGARVVTAAAVIMIGVFVGFALAGDPVIKSIGFGLAVGVLADAFLVRMTLVPAFMALMGDRMWWLPRWLDKLLPNLDIEGESLSLSADASLGEKERVEA